MNFFLSLFKEEDWDEGKSLGNSLPKESKFMVVET